MSEEYCNDTPDLVVAKLADKGVYLCSPSSMYRILGRHKLNTYRRRGKEPVREEKIVTIASKPNQVWTWDITYLRSWVRGIYFKLYVFQDLYSRKIIGWHVDENESAAIAETVLLKALADEGITGLGLRLHNDNGNPMKCVTFALKVKDLGVSQSFSRPSVSNDNPFIESLFKTLKYCPQYPYRPFNDIDEARAWVADFVSWYNESHLHSAIGYVTPGQRHRMEDKKILENRKAVYVQARQTAPERWSTATRNWMPSETTQLPKNSCRKVN